jgi:hypothetical protein
MDRREILAELLARRPEPGESWTPPEDPKQRQQRLLASPESWSPGDKQPGQVWENRPQPPQYPSIPQQTVEEAMAGGTKRFPEMSSRSRVHMAGPVQLASWVYNLSHGDVPFAENAATDLRDVLARFVPADVAKHTADQYQAFIPWSPLLSVPHYYDSSIRDVKSGEHPYRAAWNLAQAAYGPDLLGIGTSLLGLGEKIAAKGGTQAAMQAAQQHRSTLSHLMDMAHGVHPGAMVGAAWHGLQNVAHHIPHDPAEWVNMGVAREEVLKRLRDWGLLPPEEEQKKPGEG